ncbi:putative ATP-dependent endonuclease of the OLD family [Actinokineospora terrae]|uniref:Putative ATP-dependent endonuclease of the OLD family n=1 Tax=Actinokineospora terrae TaxID=155974 RepID=A0A1H9T602_9PSEU|nr:putative ATP-dependent endonuclease of the OLD family [Actinokineospora terrae]
MGEGERSVEVEWTYADSDSVESPLGASMQARSGRPTPGATAIGWTRGLSRDLGRVASRLLTPVEGDQADAFRLVYLPAWRNPVDELARREARILVELLRAQRQNSGGGRDLTGLRARASALLEQLTGDGLIRAVEERISTHLQALSAGVSRNWPYVRNQVIDDTYLARVLELMLAVLEGREHARPLEVSGLGYVNLLHIAVILAAIPDQLIAATADDPAEHPDNAEGECGTPSAESPVESDLAEAADAEVRLRQAQAERESEEDSFFPSRPLHVTVLIEEPEAHLHPQLQHSLARYLQRIVRRRPELQIILSSHATDIITSCSPEQIIVLRRDRDGRRVCRGIAELDIPDRAEVMRKTRLHLDASRSAALFAERLLLVEGVTDAALVREFGWVWAGSDEDKRSFVDALSIVPMGTKVGSWAVRLLATRGQELCDRLAVLRDSDKELEDRPTQPKWLTDAAHDPRVVRVVHSHPTLEPSITSGNEIHIKAVLDILRIEVPEPLDVRAVHELFRSPRKATATRASSPAGPAASRKGEFALELAARLAERRDSGAADLAVPDHLREIFDFLYSTDVDETPDDPSEASAANDAQE